MSKQKMNSLQKLRIYYEWQESDDHHDASRARIKAKKKPVSKLPV